MATPQVAVEIQRKRQQQQPQDESVLESPAAEEDILEDPLVEDELGEPLVDPLQDSARGVQGETPSDDPLTPGGNPHGNDHLTGSAGILPIQARGALTADPAGA